MPSEFKTHPPFEDEDFMLCYVNLPWCYFTTKPLDEQWGDDWDDAPYEHNAGEPYGPCWHNEPEYRYSADRPKLNVGVLCKCPSCLRDWNKDGTPKWALRKIAIEGHGLWEPKDNFENSLFSVKDINELKVPWLRAKISFDITRKRIYAGVTLPKFIRRIEDEFEGTVYVPREEGRN
jgi:hypothetical protein